MAEKEEGQLETAPTVRISVDDLGKMAREICLLRDKVNDLQARGTKFQIERQDARRNLRIIANRTHLVTAAELAAEHLRVFYDGWENEKGSEVAGSAHHPLVPPPEES